MSALVFGRLSEEAKADLQTIEKFADKKRFQLITKLLKQKKIEIYQKGFNTTLVNGTRYPQIKAGEGVDATDINKEIEDAVRHEVYSEFSKKAFETISECIAPNISGMEHIKKAVVLQLVSKQPIHILLIGDPGTGKCISYDSDILFSDGQIQSIGNLVESFLSQDNKEAHINKKIQLKSLNNLLKIKDSDSIEFWRKKSPKYLYKIETESGEKIKVTPTHPFLTIRNSQLRWVEAENIKIKDFLAKPSILRIKGKLQKLKNKIRISKTSGIKLKIPQKTNQDIMKLIGYLISEGNLNKTKNSVVIRFYSNDEELKQDYKKSLKKLFSNLKTNEYPFDKIAIYTPSVELFRFLESFDAKILGPSKERYLPNILLKCSDYETSALLSAIFDSEAHFSTTKLNIELTSASQKFSKQIQYLLLRFGITSSIHPRKGKATNVKNSKYKTYYKLMVYGKSNFKKFKHSINIICKRKKLALNYLVNKNYKENTNRNVIPNISPLLFRIRKELGLYQRECGFNGRLQKYENGTRNISKERLKKVVIAFKKKYNNLNLNAKVKKNIDFLRLLSESDILWTKIVKKKKIKSNHKWVYDITVPNNRNFICNNLIIHNTDILRAVADMSPVSSFGLGSGTSGAGLVVTVRGDEIIKGLLPQADNGICAIDELNLMKKEDYAGLYNAMEKGFVTYDKAGNHIKFDARIKVIATANPKEDRFKGNTVEELKSELPFDAALLTRFHLVFMLRKPDLEQFRKIAKSIIIDEEKHTKKEDINFIKDYISYLQGKEDIDFPKECQKHIIDFVEEIKKNEHNHLVEISPRFVVGIIRLCKALTRMEGRYEIEEEDVEKVKSIIKESLKIT